MLALLDEMESDVERSWSFCARFGDKLVSSECSRAFRRIVGCFTLVSLLEFASFSSLSNLKGVLPLGLLRP